jgi:integrase
MGSLKKTFYTIPMPDAAKISGTSVTWIAKGKKKTGVLTDNRRVRCQSDVWTAQFVDENGIVQRLSTKTKDRAAAQRILVKYESDVNRIRAGILSRADIDRSAIRSVPIAEFIERYRKKKIAQGDTQRHIERTIQILQTLVQDLDVALLADIDQSGVEHWIAGQMESGKRSRRTINIYVTSLNTFLNWLVDTGTLPLNPLKKIVKLNEEIGQRKRRRALTEDELKRLFDTARTRKHQKGKGECSPKDSHKFLLILLKHIGYCQSVP